MFRGGGGFQGKILHNNTGSVLNVRFSLELEQNGFVYFWKDDVKKKDFLWQACNK